MDSRQIIKEILQQYNYKNYEIVVSKDKGSKCDYKRGKTTIYINEVDNKSDANSIIVAAHEASHVLNYSEGISNLFLLKTLEKLWWLFTFVVGFVIIADFLIPIVIFHNYTIPKSMVNISIVLHIIFTITYTLYYVRDESNTEKRGIQELQKVYKNHNTFSVPLEDILKESKNRLGKWVYQKGAIILSVYSIYPFFLLGILTTMKNTM